MGIKYFRSASFDQKEPSYKFNCEHIKQFTKYTLLYLDYIDCEKTHNKKCIMIETKDLESLNFKVSLDPHFANPIVKARFPYNVDVEELNKYEQYLGRDLRKLNVNCMYKTTNCLMKVITLGTTYRNFLIWNA